MYIKRVKDLREDNDLFQKDIARVLGISQQYYSEYEKGNRPITIEKIITLAQYYNTSIDYIVGLTNETKPYPRNNTNFNFDTQN